MATPESKIKGMTDAMLKAEKVWSFSPQAGPYGVAGIPDRIAIVCGTFVGIECKANEKCKMTALQERCKEKIEAAGGKFFLVYDKATIEEARQWISHARNRGQTGGSGAGCGQAVDPRRDPNSESCEGEPDPRAALLGSYPSYAEFRVQYTKPDLTLL